MADSELNMTLVLPRPSSGRNTRIPKVLRTPKPTEIPENHVLLRVDRFGFSANNVTYQSLGEHPHFRSVESICTCEDYRLTGMRRYFDFHSLPQSDEVSSKSSGIIPVWGFATVVESSHPKINRGERVYGYLAPTRYLLLPVSQGEVNKYAFYVPRPHLPAGKILSSFINLLLTVI